MSTWNLADLIVIAREHPDETPPIPAALAGAEYYAARDATAEQWASAADIAREPDVAARLRRWGGLCGLAVSVGGSRR